MLGLAPAQAGFRGRPPPDPPPWLLCVLQCGAPARACETGSDAKPLPRLNGAGEASLGVVPGRAARRPDFSASVPASVGFDVDELDVQLDSSTPFPRCSASVPASVGSDVDELDVQLDSSTPFPRCSSTCSSLL
jgi:hypothetical protein